MHNSVDCAYSKIDHFPIVWGRMNSVWIRLDFSLSTLLRLTAPHLVSAFIGKLHFHREIVLVYSFSNWFCLIAYIYISLF